jgi:biopolymer transport protein ExbB/TolQ
MINELFMSAAAFGAGWVTWLMLALAFALTVLVLERFHLFARTRINAPRIGRALVEHLERGDLEEARLMVSRGVTMEERVVADGLSAWERGPRAVAQAMNGALERERQRFERFLGPIGTVGANAPFIGLLGTVIGIVLSFQQLAANPKGGMAVVGAGLAEALISTGVGLLVAIPAVVAFNHFRGLIARRVGNVRFLSGVLLAQLERGGE